MRWPAPLSRENQENYCYCHCHAVSLFVDHSITRQFEHWNLHQVQHATNESTSTIPIFPSSFPIPVRFDTGYMKKLILCILCNLILPPSCRRYPPLPLPEQRQDSPSPSHSSVAAYQLHLPSQQTSEATVSITTHCLGYQPSTVKTRMLGFTRSVHYHDNDERMNE